MKKTGEPDTPIQTLYLNFNIQRNQKQTGRLSQANDMGTQVHSHSTIDKDWRKLRELNTQGNQT